MASVTKRRWTYKGVTKEGWEVRYFDDKGVRRSKTLPLKKDADAFKRKVEREIEDGVHVTDADTCTVSEASAEYLLHNAQRLSDGRIGRSHHNRQELCCRRWIVPQLGRIRLKDLKLDDVMRLYRVMAAGGMRPDVAKNYVQDFLMIERYARKRGWTKTQPVADALSDMKGIQRRPVETFEVVEVGQLLRCAAERAGVQAYQRDRLLMHCAVSLAALCGLRWGEISGLTLGAVDLDKRIIDVRHSLTAWGELKGPKTQAGKRTVVIPSRLLPLLIEWVERFRVDGPVDLFFTTRTGARQTYANFRKAWVDLLAAAELPSRHFHALRHFHASWLIHNGLPPTEVAKTLGHSHFDMTLRVYSHALMDETDRVTTMDRISGLLPAAAATLTQ